MELSKFDYERSARFSCLGSEWELVARFVRKPRMEFAITLTYRSSTSCSVTYKLHGHSAITKTFHCGTKDEQVSRKCIHFNLRGIEQNALVIEVFMMPASHTFHAYLPTNPSACKIVQDLFNDKKFADIIFEVGEGIKTSDANESKNMPSSIKYYAHRIIIEKAAPLLAEFCVSDEFPSLVKLEDVSPAVFEDLLRYVYGIGLREHDGKGISHTKEIIEIADKYGVTNLKLHAEAYYVSSLILDSNNLMENIHFAQAKNCALLREAVIDYIVENMATTVENQSLSQFPFDLINDVLVAVIRKAKVDNTYDGEECSELSIMSVSELRHRAHVKGLDVDGSREMLISSLLLHENTDFNVLIQHENNDTDVNVGALGDEQEAQVHDENEIGD